MNYHGIIHVATNRSLIRSPDSTRSYPSTQNQDLFGHEPAKTLLHFGSFTGSVPAGRQLTELEMYLCRYEWFAKKVLGLEPPKVFQPTMLSDSSAYLTSLKSHLTSQNYERLAGFWHGFNTTTLDGYQRALSLGEALHRQHIGVSAMSWPSHGKPTVSAYFADLGNNAASIPASNEFLHLNIEAVGSPDKFMAVGHSLGAYLLLNSILDRYNSACGKPEKLCAIFLVSPDVDTVEFLNRHAEALLASVSKIWILISKKDLALFSSELLRELGVDNNHSRLGQADNPPVISGINFFDDTKNDHGILGHMIRLRTISQILETELIKSFGNPFANPSLYEVKRDGSSAHYVLKRCSLW